MFFVASARGLPRFAACFRDRRACRDGSRRLLACGRAGILEGVLLFNKKDAKQSFVRAWAIFVLERQICSPLRHGLRSESGLLTAPALVLTRTKSTLTQKLVGQGSDCGPPKVLCTPGNAFSAPLHRQKFVLWLELELFQSHSKPETGPTRHVFWQQLTQGVYEVRSLKPGRALSPK